MRQCVPIQWTGMLLLAGLVLAAGVQAAQAMPKLNESGEFDCSCQGGQGTCDFVSAPTGTSCFKSVEDTCTGTCKLTLTPDTPQGSRLQNSIIPGTTNGVKLRRR